MVWVAGTLLIILLAAIYYLLRNNQKPKHYNPSVIVDMDDQPPTEIDFEAGIKANQKTSKNPTGNDA